jgi:hypothetical protein
LNHSTTLFSFKGLYNTDKLSSNILLSRLIRMQMKLLAVTNVDFYVIRQWLIRFSISADTGVNGNKMV